MFVKPDYKRRYLNLRFSLTNEVSSTDMLPPEKPPKKNKRKKKKKVNIFKYPRFTLKQGTYVTHHHFGPDNHTGSGLLTRRVGFLLKSNGGGGWETQKSQRGERHTGAHV